MFRIHFDEATSCFVIQVLRYGFWWRTVKRTIVGSDKPDVKIEQMFGTLAEARQFAGEIGLNVLYQDRSADAYRAHMRAA